MLKSSVVFQISHVQWHFNDGVIPVDYTDS